MDQRGDRRRAFHRVWQPGVQEKLRRFPHRTDEEQHGDGVDRIDLIAKEVERRLRQFWTHGQDHIEIDAVRHPEEREDPKKEAEIANPVDDEGFHRRSASRGFAVVKADQQVGRDTHALPTEEELQEVIGRDQHQHGEGEERQIGKETRAIALALFEIVVMGHVAERIEMHERRDRGDHDQHDRGQPVDANAPGGVERTRGDPSEKRLGVIAILMGAWVEAQEDDPAQQHRQEQEPGRCGAGRLFPDQPPGKSANEGTNQRREEEDRFHGALALHHIDIFHRDRAAVAEETDQNGQTDRRLGGSNGQHEHGEDLPRQIT